MYDNPLNATPDRDSSAPAPGSPSAGPANYYAPPIADDEPLPTYEEEGNYGLGMIVGLVFSLLGLIIVAIAGKAATRRGALHGFLIRLGLGVLMLMITGVFF